MGTSKKENWLLCPVCGNKTRLQIRADTELKNFPLYCPKCKQESLIDAKDLQITVVKSGFVGILRDGNMIVGTGCYKDNHITRVYVKTKCQGKGYGSYIMQCLENQIRLQYDTLYLDASLPASHLYEKRGYQTTKHEKWNVENGKILVYEVMVKSPTDL